MSTTAAVTIACPEWCSRTKEQHQREVDAGERYLVHQSLEAGDARDWIVTMMQSPDGTPTPEAPGLAPVNLMDGDDVIHPDDAERHALALLNMVATARRTQVVR